ncbi:MAG: glucose-6-phosphate dehydrogenase assembly protein OpcA [Bryobacterales bacterium]|nr:glucose-6-phosphate dehydrogenase assembly protein OpcA [Bryobacterales bacterium]
MSAVASVQPDKLLKELDELWRNLGNEQEGGVLRACAMTLIVCTQGEQDEVGETLALLMREYPARAIVLRETDGSAPALGAGVRAQCWTPFGSRQQICCELIEITASRASLADVQPVIHALTAPDLPIVIWCRTAAIVTVEDFQPILRLANKLIVDTAGASDLREQLRYMRAAEDADTTVADLAWTRLTHWRSSVATMFDNPANLAQVRNINAIKVRYQGAYVPLSAYYMVGWLQHVLGRTVSYDFQSVPDDCARARVEMVSLHAPGWQVSLQVNQDRAAHVDSFVQDSHAILPRRTDYDLLREELALTARDPIYQATLGVVAGLIA